MGTNHWKTLTAALEVSTTIFSLDSSSPSEKARTVVIDEEAAKCIGNMLSVNKSIKKLEFHNCGLTSTTAAAILLGLTQNLFVTYINISCNTIEL